MPNLTKYLSSLNLTKYVTIVPQTSPRIVYALTWLFFLLLPKPDHVFYLSKPNQVFLFAKPIQVFYLPKPNQVLKFLKPNQVFQLPKPQQHHSIVQAGWTLLSVSPIHNPLICNSLLQMWSSTLFILLSYVSMILEQHWHE